MKVREIAGAIGAKCEGNGEVDVFDLMPLDSAGPKSLTFLANPRYASRLSSTRAGAVILGPGVEGPGCTVLRVDDPYLAFTRALEIFAAPLELPVGIDAAARIAASASIGETPRIAPGVMIGERCRIGARAVLHPGVVIYPDVEIGDDFTAHANVVIRERVRIGARVMLASGVVIGSDGFGFVPLPGGGVVKLMQVGTVEIADDVEIGANTTVDRATIGKTVIERGAKIDNLVMIAHGCRVGEEALIAAQTGLAGSTIVGARAQLGGQVGAAGHITIGEGARLAGQSGVVGDVPAGAEMAGYPAIEAGLWRRVSVAVKQLPEILRRLRRLETAQGAPRTKDDV